MKINNSIVSICIPTYNHGRFLPDAIMSALNQTYENIEIIVVDNCSTDNTKEVMQYLISSNMKVKCYFNENNLGLVGNMNKCIKYAKGEYIKILCADDRLEPTCIDKSLRILEQYNNVELVSVGRLLVSEDLSAIKTLSYSNKFEVVKGFKAIEKCLVEGNLIGEPSAVLFRKKSALCGFNTKYTQLTDLDMWLRLLENGDLIHIPDILCNIRIHKEQETRKNIISLSFADEIFNLLNEYLNKDYISLSFVKKNIARYNRAYRVWDLRCHYSFWKALKKISEHYNIFNFLVLLVIRNILSLLSYPVKYLLK